MSFTPAQAVNILKRTPSVLNAMLRGTDPAWHRVNEGPNTWSAFDVVGHLIFGEETDWIPRACIILEQGVDRPFDPFDRFAHLEKYGDWMLDDLLDRFAELRSKNLQTLEIWHLTDDQLSLQGSHPELGIVTLRQLMATWAVHDLNHIGQIIRVLAKAHTADVGPWKAYLSVLGG